MKNITILFVLFFAALTLNAQKTIEAKSILEAINKGEYVNIENSTIEGDLILIDLDDKEIEKEKKEIKIKYHVREAIKFSNCTFKGKVEAYRYDEDEKTLHSVDFHSGVIFLQCKFEKDVLFKYSKFYITTVFDQAEFQGVALFKYAEFIEDGTFASSTFQEEANFKYTEFNKDAFFTNCNFIGDANFKYTDFEGEADFKNSNFKDDATFKYVKFEKVDLSNIKFYSDANFKYAEFPEGVDFSNTIFDGFANFKYADFESINIKGTKFKGDTDFKNTKVDGKSFIKVLLEEKDND